MVAFLYENDQEQMQFVRDYFDRIPQRTPKVLVHTKTDLLKSASDYILPTASFASQLKVKVWKESSCKEKRTKEALEAILSTAIEPQRGLTDEEIELTKSESGGSEFWTSPVVAILTLLTGVLAVGLLWKVRSAK